MKIHKAAAFAVCALLAAAAGRTTGEVGIAVSGDSRGCLIGTVSQDKGRTGLAGEAVTVSGGSWTRNATTGENGLFSVPVPLNAAGKITIAAAGRRLDVDAADLPLRLTAPPLTRRLSLEGTWRILIDPPADWRSAPGWREIKVPSNWEMKGFRSETGTAVMRRMFELPRTWKGKLVKLRADGIYSGCEAWLNGVRVGSHDGGATPVELDLTAAAKYGEANTLDVLIRARTRAADIDHMSVYADFELAGIWRPIEVFAVEPVHVARTAWSVEYDKGYRDADITVTAALANAQAVPVKDGTLSVQVLDPELRSVKAATWTVSLDSWEEKAVPMRLHIESPEPWTAERPRLYRIAVTFNGSAVESPLAFRQTEVLGKRFTINGRGVKLFGACLHSADPVLGRAIPPSLVEKDLDLMKACNLNAIRTSHYPPIPIRRNTPTGSGSISKTKGRPAGPRPTTSATCRSTWAFTPPSWSATATIHPLSTGRCATRAVTPGSSR